MARYRTRPAEVNAVRFTGDNWEEMASFAREAADLRGAFDTGVAHDASSHSLLIKTSEGRLRCRAGDWVVQDRGHLHPWDDASFTAAYEPVDVLQDA